MKDRASDEQLWSWIDRGAASEIRQYLLSHPGDRPRVDELQTQIDQVTAQIGLTPTRLPACVGPYEVVRQLGEGGMGIVFEGIRRDLDRTAALKIRRRTPGQDDSHALRRFQREISALAKLDHPGIARFFEAGKTDDGDLWFAMEKVDGVPIDVWIDQDAPGLQDRLTAFRKIAFALDEAHGVGIVHRDLKPSNILIRTDGAPKVLDFGLARQDAHDTSISLTATESGALIGTLQYMSPEQARGDRDGIDARSDVYALGVLLYRMVTGALPYRIDPSSLVAAVETIQGTPPVRPSKIDPTIHRDLETILLTALEKSPDRRYASARAFAEDAERWSARQPIVARPIGAPTRAWRLAARHPVASVVTIAVIAIASISGAAYYLKKRPQISVTEGLDTTSEFEPRRYPKLSPFETIDWIEGSPIVTVRSTRYELLAIADEPVELVIGLCKKIETNVSWKKRFTEDLYEVLLRLKQDQVADLTHVSLDVIPIEDPAQGRVRIQATMTEENRERVKERRRRTSAFSGYRWAGDTIEIRLEDGWHTWRGLAGLELEDLYSVAREAFGSLAKKRVGEDLVTLLDHAKYAYDPDQLTLILEPIGGGERFHRTVRMTHRNRTDLILLRESLKKKGAENDA